MNQSPRLHVSCYVVCSANAERTPIQIFTDIDASVAFQQAFGFLREYNSRSTERAVLRRGAAHVSWTISSHAARVQACGADHIERLGRDEAAHEPADSSLLVEAV